jgi:hypothetical protein
LVTFLWPYKEKSLGLGDESPESKKFVAKPLPKISIASGGSGTTE